MTELQLVTDAERERVTAALDSARSPSTRLSYASAWKQWEQWCAARGATALPGSPELVAVYLTTLADSGLSASTIDKTLAAIRAGHVDVGADDPTAHSGVTRVRQGLRRTIGTAAKKQAHPLSTDEIRLIIAGIEGDGLRALRDRALILLGYAAALRRSELVALDVEDLTRKRSGYVVNIRRSKADQEAEGQIVGVARGQHPETDPVAALDRWLKGSGIKTGPLFRSIAWSDRRVLDRRMDGKAVNLILTDRAETVGLHLPNLSGHSLRAGHATQAAENGVPAERLARTTRHKNLSVLAGYVRPAQVLTDTTAKDLGL